MLDYLKIVAVAGLALSPTVAFADWSGSYVGLSYGSVTGDLDFDPSPDQALDDGTVFGLYGGYQVQMNALVYGGEIAFANPDGTAVTGFDGVSEITEPVFDFKGRVGYPTGQILIYGVLGLSTGTYTNVIGDPNEEWDLTGFNYGLGAEYMVNPNYIVGVEYLARDMEGDNPFGGGQTAQVDFDTLSLRLAYKF